MTKHWLTVALAVVLWGCSSPTEKNSQKEEVNEPIPKEKPKQTELKRPELQRIIDSAQVEGSILIYHPTDDTYYSNNFERAHQGYLPASTFKIVNSILALETETIADENVVMKWNGEKRRMRIWETDMTFYEAYHKSCLPCYQEIARKMGYVTMNKLLTSFNFGHMVFDSTNFDKFWVEGESRITQHEQIDFLVRLHDRKLPISDRTYNIMSNLMILEETNEYTLRGKTGWSIRDGFNIGWFVGYVELKSGDVYYVATNIEPNETFNMDFFAKIRSEITMKALRSLNIIT